MKEYLLETKNITKQYGSFKAVDDVSVHIEKGAIYGFIGRNGAGKTTFLKMISGLASKNSGSIELFGNKINSLSDIHGRIGCLIEEPGLYQNMSAYENIKIKCMLFGLDKSSYIEDLLKTVGLDKTGHKKVKKFSLGMKQRLGIALALIGEPDLLVLDEPINGLDPQGIAEIRDTILKLRDERNMTVLISSHILEELSKIATDYGIIHHGSLIKELTKEELLSKCNERIEIVLDNPLEALPVLDKMGFNNYKVVDSTRIQVYERLSESYMINRELVMSNINVKEIFVITEELEEYFLNLTGGAANV